MVVAKVRCLALIACCFAVSCLGQPIREARKFSKKELQADFQQLTQLLKAHPALYRFTSKTDFDALVKSQLGKVNDSLSLREFYKVCVPIVTAIGCGHTKMNTEGILSRSPFKFPFDFFIKEKRMFVTRTSDPGQIPLRSEVISINGEPFESIYKTLSGRVSSDGFNQSYRNTFLNEYFEQQYVLYYGFTPELKISITTPGHESRNLKFVTADLSSWQRNLIYPLKECETGVCLDIRDNPKHAVLTIPGFHFYGDRLPQFKKLIDSCFQVIKKRGVDKLIVDIRHNGGGDPFNASYLLSYLSSKPISYFEKGTPNYDAITAPVPPAANRFTGACVFITDGYGFSTVGHLAALVKYHKIATIVGEETGGTFTCNDSSIYSTLDNTGISLRIAQRTFKVVVSGMDFRTGVVPDIPVRWEVDDIINSRDRLMEEAVWVVGGK